MTRVLVTGGAGYIGCAVVSDLLSQGFAVRILDRLYWGRQPLQDVIDDVELIHGDIRDLRDEWLLGVDAVVHLAALSNDPTAEYDPRANWEINALATEQLALTCKRLGVARFTFGSSCSIYDGLPPGVEYTEEQEVHPQGAYSQAKYYAENRLRQLADASFCPVILRQATVFGFSPRMRYDLVVNTFVKDALQTGCLRLHGGGRMWRPLVDIGDAAQAHIACLLAPPEKVRGELFNVVQDNYQIRALAMMIADSLRLEHPNIRLEEVPSPVRPRDYRCSSAKMAAVLGFKPQVTIPVSVAHMMACMMARISRDGLTEFDHPRYYNIRWMELLREVHQNLRPFQSVLSEDN